MWVLLQILHLYCSLKWVLWDIYSWEWVSEIWSSYKRQWNFEAIFFWVEDSLTLRGIAFCNFGLLCGFTSVVRNFIWIFPWEIFFLRENSFKEVLRCVCIQIFFLLWHIIISPLYHCNINLTQNIQFQWITKTKAIINKLQQKRKTYQK